MSQWCCWFIIYAKKKLYSNNYSLELGNNMQFVQCNRYAKENDDNLSSFGMLGKWNHTSFRL